MNDRSGIPDEGGAEQEVRYVAAIETHLRRLRGTALLLSPEDLERALGWFRREVPLNLVLEIMDEVFERSRERRPRREPRSLAYCAPAIEDAVAARQELLLGRRTEGAREESTELDRMFDEALAAIGRCAAPSHARTRAANRLREWRLGEAVDAGPRETLAAIDAELVSACHALLAEDDLQAIAADVDRLLAPYASEMTAERLGRTRASAIARGVRRRFALPDLTLLPTTIALLGGPREP